MIKSALETVKKYDMLRHGDVVVVGVSGGADSVALLMTLCGLREELALTLYAVHVNHSIRGDDADSDQHFVEELCMKLDVECRAFVFDVPAYAEENGLSSEEAGRKLRYEAFEKVAEEISASRIATAHHANDNCETVIHNILRGSGTTGLSGIHPVRGKYIRPLIETEKKEIEEYLTSEGVEWCTDKTNFEPLYTRNKIRLELIPYLRENYNASIDSAIMRLSALCREDDDYMREETGRYFRKLTKRSQGRILAEREGFNKLHIAIKRRLLRFILEELEIPLKDVHMVHIDSAIRMIEESESGAEQKISLCRIRVIQSGVLFENEQKAVAEDDYEYELDVDKSVFVSETGETVSLTVSTKYEKSGADTVFIDAGSVTLPMKVRNRRPGDRFRPFGMKGSKKLKDFFIDKKIDVSIRNNIPIVVSGNDIVWISGNALSENNRITQKTENIYKLHIEK